MITRSYIRGPLLVMAVLLAGAANLLCVSCDADHDAETPPLIVQFSFATGANAGVHARRSIASSPVTVTLEGQTLVLLVLKASPLLATSTPEHPLFHATLAPPLLC